MIEIINFEELNVGDQILVNTHDQHISVHQVKEILWEDLLITTDKSDPLDLAIEETDKIVKVGTKEKPLLHVYQPENGF